MIKHIVLFKLTSSAGDADKKYQLEQLNEIFSALPEQLGFITEFRTGVNFTIADHAWDFAIDSVFSTKEDLNRYQVSKEHQEAVRKASTVGKIKAVVDYEF